MTYEFSLTLEVKDEKALLNEARNKLRRQNVVGRAVREIVPDVKAALLLLLDPADDLRGCSIIDSGVELH